MDCVCVFVYNLLPPGDLRGDKEDMNYYLWAGKRRRKCQNFDPDGRRAEKFLTIVVAVCEF